MATIPKIKSKKEVLAENLTELIDRNPTMAALILLAVFLSPWYIGDFVSPAVRFSCLVVAPQIWRSAVEWLTQPVLFLLVNLVIVSIWISSGSMSWASNGEDANLSEKHANVGKVNSDRSASTVACSSPSPSDKNLQKTSPFPRLPSRPDSDQEWQFSPPKRSLSFSCSGNTSKLLPQRPSFSTFSAKQLGASLVPNSTPEIRTEQMMEPTSSQACQSDRKPASIECIFQPQSSKSAEADNSRRRLSDASRGERRNYSLQRQSSEQMKKTSWKSYSEHKEPSWKSHSEQGKSTWKSYSEKSRTDTVSQTGEEYVQKASSSKRSAYAHAPSSVIVRDISVDTDNIESTEQPGMRDPLVIDKDELNERIEAFFARFREQLRQDSLRWN
ncbi:hypothetical protein O6H91_13G042900 [Diphasiastrum complanatum]|uniref:Uncharacterized protein n=1 Tax=Diphasiastrum complanatum TaxID=34168 RepID=A0ACC2BU79_DIPCM|nr:hypothetical protein O6H91_13G042900 [Diphasiastrum complanatum]